MPRSRISFMPGCSGGRISRSILPRMGGNQGVLGCKKPRHIRRKYDGAFVGHPGGLRCVALRIIRGNMRISEGHLKRQALADHTRNQVEQPLIWGFRTEKMEQVRSLDQSCYPAVTCTNTKEVPPPLTCRPAAHRRSFGHQVRDDVSAHTSQALKRRRCQGRSHR